jgi:hypothetical protein
MAEEIAKTIGISLKNTAGFFIPNYIIAENYNEGGYRYPDVDFIETSIYFVISFLTEKFSTAQIRGLDQETVNNLLTSLIFVPIATVVDYNRKVYNRKIGDSGKNVALNSTYVKFLKNFIRSTIAFLTNLSVDNLIILLKKS